MSVILHGIDYSTQSQDKKIKFGVSCDGGCRGQDISFSVSCEAE